jgi:hypothetical protein
VVSDTRAPRNKTTRAERIQAWNDARNDGMKFCPERIVGRDARYRWLDSIVASDLIPTTRLVAHTLAMHGRTDGTNIFPSTRRLASTSGLSERAVCVHLDLLVRRGFLGREARYGDTAGARGFKYLLYVPRVLTFGQRAAQTDQTRNAVSPMVSVLIKHQHRRKVLIESQHSADRKTGSADASGVAVLTDGQPIQELPIHRTTHLPTREPARALEGARTLGSESEAR